MTHAPMYWVKEIAQAQRPVLLTVSGHTHGLQIGYRTAAAQWSLWNVFHEIGMGLYENNGRYLYVNTGFGVVGFPFRIGLHPEITVLTLEKR
jgi:predicted MPP superfamily phosphohydrolase